MNTSINKNSSENKNLGGSKEPTRPNDLQLSMFLATPNALLRGLHDPNTQKPLFSQPDDNHLEISIANHQHNPHVLSIENQRET